MVPAHHRGEPLVVSWTEEGWAAEETDAPPEWHQRRVIQLGVLVRESQRNA